MSVAACLGEENSPAFHNDWLHVGEVHPLRSPIGPWNAWPRVLTGFLAEDTGHTRQGGHTDNGVAACVPQWILALCRVVWHGEAKICRALIVCDC